MKVLFVGNSHTFFNDMPALFAEMAKKSGAGKVTADMLAYSGRDYAWHRTEYFALRYALLYGGYDFCVLQQAAHPYPPAESTLEYGRDLIEMCKRAGVKPVVYMTWAEKRFPENQQKMTDTCEKLAEETGALLCRVGQIWQRILRECPDIELFYDDGEHAGPYGDFLIAAAFCRLLAGRVDPSVSGIGKSFLIGDPIDMDRPRMKEDRAAVSCVLDAEKTERILRAVESIQKPAFDLKRG